MFRVEPNGPNRLDVEISGKLDSASMKVALDAIITGAEGFEHGRMRYRITDFKLPTITAMAVECSHLFPLIKLIGKFDRVAVLADREWIQTASEIEGALIPGLAIKAFDLDEEADAEEWLTT